MNLYEKIVEVRKSIHGLSKDKEGYQFSYVTGNQILGKIKGKMNELGLILQPSTKTGEWSRHDYKNNYNKDKIDFIVWGQASYTWINAEKPEEREVVDFAYYGQQGDDLSQAYGTALTYAERYFLLKYFGIPTDEDDADAKQFKKDDKPVKNTPQQNKTVTTVDNMPNDKISTSQLTTLAASKGIAESYLIEKYKKEEGKTVTEVKFIAADIKKKYFDALSKLPNK